MLIFQGCISLQPTAQPPFLERPPRRRAVHPRRESDPILASIKTRKISEKFQQNHSILAYTNCEEFPMKFPRSLNSPQLWRISHLLSNCCEMVGFFFGRSRGPPEKNCQKGSTFSWPWKSLPFIITKAAAHRWNLRSEEVEILKDQEIWQDSVQGQQRFFPFRKKKSPFMKKMPFKTLMGQGSLIKVIAY